MNQPQKPNSWSRAAMPQATLDPHAADDRMHQVEWSLAPLSVLDSAALFEPVLANPLLRALTVFAKRKMVVLCFGLLLLGASGYCFTAPPGSTLAGLPLEYWSIGLAAVAILLTLAVTLGAWLRPLESVEDAIEVLSVPLMIFEKGGGPDVR